VYFNFYTKLKTPNIVGNCHFTMYSKQFHFDAALRSRGHLLKNLQNGTLLLGIGWNSHSRNDTLQIHLIAQKIIPFGTILILTALI
jgi:hypothetical protein